MFPHRSPFPPLTPNIFKPGDWTPTKLWLFHNLVRLSTPWEDNHLSLTTFGVITPERGLLPLSHYPGGLSPPREDFHLSLTTLGNYYPPREDYHLSLTTLAGYNPLERIITSLSLPGGLLPPRDDYHLRLSLLWEIVTPSSLQPLPWGITNPDTECPVVLVTILHPLPLFRPIILVQLFAFIVRVMGWEH